MKTIRGIYYDLEESDYTITINKYKFVFSSLLYLNKFRKLLNNKLNLETLKYKNKLDINNIEEVIFLKLYKDVEKRGFLVYYNNVKLDNYRFIVNLQNR